MSAVSLLAVNRALPSAAELGRLTLFYALSWQYVMLFALIGMVTALLTRRRSLALLAALGVWLVLTFAVPQPILRRNVYVHMASAPLPAMR